MLTRRYFLRGSAIVMAGAGAAPLWLARTAAAAEGKKKTLVAIFQRGAADALSIVAPFGEKRYKELRPTLGNQATLGLTGSNGSASVNGEAIRATDLDGKFALNPWLQPMKGLWDKKQLAIVHAVGSPDPSRSHFDAQDFMESGTPGKASADGWLNRALTAPGPQTSPVRAVTLGSQMPRTLRGDRPAISVSDMMSFQSAGGDASAVIESMYAASGDPRLAATAKEAFEAKKLIQSINQTYDFNSQNAYLQAGQLGQSLQQLARLIKADVGVEAAFAEIGGWDHHQNEANQLSNLLRQFAAAISAFVTDLGDRMQDVVIVTMSEFGRTAQENGDGGTDHGHGGMMMVLGGAVNGGKVYGKWPGLEREQLYEGRDLAVTTDFRDVLGELIGAQLGQKDFGHVFPDYRVGEPLGLLRG
jgi:uncharacterized protein (DUF1501 family)